MLFIYNNDKHLQKPLPLQLLSALYIVKNHTLSARNDALPVDTSIPTNKKCQKSWHLPTVQYQLGTLLAHCADQISCSHILGASSYESGALLNAMTFSFLVLCEMMLLIQLLVCELVPRSAVVKCCVIIIVIVA